MSRETIALCEACGTPYAAGYDTEGELQYQWRCPLCGASRIHVPDSLDEPPRVTSTMATNALTSHVLTSDDDVYGSSNSLPDGVDFDQFDDHSNPVME